MNCQDFENLLADYLGDELSETARSECQLHLADCDKCRTEVEELGGTIESLRELHTVSSVIARERTASLTVVRKIPPLLNIAATLLKAAALIALGVGIGWQIAPKAQPAPPQEAVVASTRSDTHLHPGWIQRAKNLPESASSSSFARNLGAIAGTLGQ